MKFAKRVFFWSGVYGMACLLPMYFLEDWIGRRFPPAGNHPEQYYAFIGVALAWQFAFLLISRDPLRYRPMMIPAIAEKLLVAGAAILLFTGQRIGAAVIAPFLLDGALGVLFIAAYLKTGRTVAAEHAAGQG